MKLRTLFCCIALGAGIGGAGSNILPAAILLASF